MVLPHGKTGDLYHRYRPLKFNEVVGHKAVIESIRKAMLSDTRSNSYMLIGSSGCGKTTTARIMALSLNCEDRDDQGDPCLRCNSCKVILSGNCLDVMEINAADTRGIDDARNMKASMSMMPMQVKNKVYILDECQSLTPDAQNTLLKVLEDAPPHVYIILCTTDPQKIKNTVKNRCQRFIFQSLLNKDILRLLLEVAVLEGHNVDKSNQILKMIADRSEGCPRQALVYLQQIIQLGFDDPQSAASLLATEESADKNAISLCIHLTKRDKCYWSTLMSILEDAKEVGPPAIGMILAGYFRNRLKKAKKPEEADYFAKVLSLFIEPFPESKLGENHLVLNLYKAYKIGRGKELK